MRIIRDPIYGDVPITRMEHQVVNTVEMLRLNRLRELHLTYLVYPGATHTRYEHSLGTRALAEIILQKSQLEELLSADEKNVLFLACLLHDVGHACFDHVLKPSNFQGLRRHEEMVLQLLEGKVKRLYHAHELVSENEHAQFLVDVIPKVLREKVAAVLTFDEVGGRQSADEPTALIAQMVSSIVDIDGLDYLRRDAFHVGLPVPYDDSIYSSFRIVRNPATKAPIVCFEADRRTTRALEQVLLARWQLFERVYLHHTVMAANAMLVQALGSALSGTNDDFMRLYTMGDDDLLFHLLHHDLEQVSEGRLLRARTLIRRLLCRDLFKRAYGITIDDSIAGKRARAILENSQTRDAFHEHLAKHGLTTEDYVVSSPIPAPWKPFQSIPLRSGNTFGEEEETLCRRLKEKYDDLNILYIFSPQADDEHRRRIYDACRSFFQQPEREHWMPNGVSAITPFEVDALINAFDAEIPRARKLVELLAEGRPMSNAELGRRASLSMPSVSQYLNRIKDLQSEFHVPMLVDYFDGRQKLWVIRNDVLRKALQSALSRSNVRVTV